MRKSTHLLVGVIASVSLLAAACGSDDGDFGDRGNGEKKSGGPAADAPKLSGEPVKVGVTGPLNSTTLSFPGVQDMIKVAEAAVNAEGGINGRPFEVVYCDTKAVAEQAALCARSLIEDEKVSLIAGNHETTGVNAIYSVVEKAGIASLGNVGLAGTVEVTSPNSFPLLATSNSNAEMAAALDDFGIKKVALMCSDSAACQANVDQIKENLDPGVEVEDITFPAGTVDWAPFCLQAQQADADAVWISYAAFAVTAAVQTCLQRGMTDVIYMTGDSSISQELVDLLSDRGADSILAAAFSSEIYEMLGEDLANYGDDDMAANYYAVDLITWYGIRNAAVALREAPSTDPDEVFDWLSKQDAFPAIGQDPVDFTKPGPIEDSPRVPIDYVGFYKAEDGKLTGITP